MKIRNFILLTVVLTTGIARLGWSQVTITNTDPPRTCATMTQDSINRIRFPERQTLDEFEQAIKKKIIEINERSAN